MKSRLVACLSLIAAILVICSPVFAHHGNAAYDEKNPVTIKGTVTEFEFVNPHAQIYLDVKDDKGNVTHWAVETLSPGKLVRAGWTKDVLKAGDQVTITLAAAKNGSPVGFLNKLLFADGKELGIKEQAQ